jgi:hypothetical protein
MARLAPLLAPLFALLLMAAADEAAARTPFEARCEARQLGLDTDSRPTGVRVESHHNGYRVDNSLSYRSLTRLKPEGAGSYVLGLTRAESRVVISVEGAIFSDPDTGEECFLPQIGVSLSYQRIRAGQLCISRDTCARNAPSQSLRRLPAESGRQGEGSPGPALRRPSRVCAAWPVAAARAG